ncbi:MAG TPA: DUF2934 domain-containing protein [Thermodesulfobacteriota bacterium]
MATTTRRRPPTRKKAATPAAEPTSAHTGEAVRTDVSPTAEGIEAPSAGSASTRGAIDQAPRPADGDLHDAIARRAYEIYERDGRPEGRALEHWRQAEAEIRAERAGR